MSCGRPVILSDIKGLWSKDILLHGENCLLVRPGDADALSQAIASLRSDAALRERLGRNARATALAHFGLNKTAGGTLELARLGLDLHASRTRRAA
jgi:glycosyltransferase involved in cell wall biosynthesis